MNSSNMDKSHKNNILNQRSQVQDYVYMSLPIESFKTGKTNLFVRSQNNSGHQRPWWWGVGMAPGREMRQLLAF